MSNIYESIERICGIDLSVFNDNKSVLDMFTNKVLEILDSYKINSKIFLNSFINNLNKYFDLDFTTYKDSDIKYVEVYDKSLIKPCPPVTGEYVYDYIDYPYRKISVKKDNIYLVSKKINAKMFYASKGEKLYPDDVINNSIYDYVSFNSLDNVSFTDIIKEIFLETYFDLISEKKGEIRKKIIDYFVKYISNLENKKNYLIVKKEILDNKYLKLQSDYDSIDKLNPDEFTSKNNDRYLLYEDVTEFDCILNDIEIFEKKFQNEERSALKDLAYDPACGNYTIYYYVEWDNDLKNVSDMSDKYVTVPKKLRKIIDLYKDYILNVSFEYYKDGIKREKYYSKEDYGFDFCERNFNSEDSCKLKINVDNKKISINKYLKVLNKLENLIKSITKIEDLYTLDEIHKIEFDVLNSFLDCDYSLRGILLEKNIEEMYKYLRDHNYSSGFYTSEKDKIISFLDKVLSVIDEIKFLLDSIEKRNMDVKSKNDAVSFYNKLYRNYSKQLKLENKIRNNNNVIRKISTNILVLDNLITFINEKLNTFKDDDFVYKKVN